MKLYSFGTGRLAQSMRSVVVSCINYAPQQPTDHTTVSPIASRHTIPGRVLLAQRIPARQSAAPSKGKHRLVRYLRLRTPFLRGETAPARAVRAAHTALGPEQPAQLVVLSQLHATRHAGRATERGLRVRGRIHDWSPEARFAQALAGAGALDGLSIGFRSSRARREGRLRVLVEVELWEVSLVTFPMLPGARFRPETSPGRRARFPDRA